MRFTSFILGITIAFILTGCVTSPQLPTIETAKGDRVGFLVEGGNTPTHSHVGTTVFNNFVKKYDYNWNLKAEVATVVRRSISNAGYVAVDLQSEGLRYSDVEDLIQPVGDRWEPSKGKGETLRRLQSDLRLKALVVLKESRVMAALECSGGPCSERYADAPGLFTRSFLGLTNYSAVAAYRWNVFVLDPPADTAKADPLLSIVRAPATPIRGFNSPADFRNLTEAEFAPVHEAVVTFMEGATAAAMKSLNSKSDAEGKP